MSDKKRITRKGLVWTDDKIERLRSLYSQGLPTTRIAEVLTREFGRYFSVSAVAAAVYHYLPTEKSGFLGKDEKNYIVFCTPRLPERDYMLCSDVHAPFHSNVWLDRYLAVARKFEIKHQIIAGDLLDFDCFSGWEPDGVVQRENLEDELESARDVIRKMKSVFVKSYHATGNHERRISKMAEARIASKTIMSFFGPDYVSSFEYVVYDKVFIGDRWMVVHPKDYSATSGSVAFSLSVKYQRNVLSTHGHFVSLRYDPTGLFIVGDIGGLFDWTKVAYVNLRTTKHPFWNNGFAMIRKGKLHLFHNETDWDFYGIKL